jgi:xanthine dehydrogenase accessory factor
MASLIIIRGGGDLASGVALRLHRAGLSVVITELAQPLAVRRSVAFAEAVYEGRVKIEGVEGRKVDDPADTLSTLNILGRRQIPVLVDPDAHVAGTLHPIAIVDGRMTKREPEPMSHSALLYIGLGPGFMAPDNCHAVVETERGHALGRVIWKGQAQDDSGQPQGDPNRILRAPADGVLESTAKIGQLFEAGSTIAVIAGQPITAPFRGVLRGILRPGTAAQRGMKIGDIDSRGDPRLCQTASDKAIAVGGGVLEALLARPEVRSKLWA